MRVLIVTLSLLLTGCATLQPTVRVGCEKRLVDGVKRYRCTTKKLIYVEVRFK